jgi:membrane peptidoglycan carboxypeptidase
VHFNLSAQDAAAMQFPTDWLAASDDPSEGLDDPSGMVVKHVLSELSHSDNPTFSGMSWETIRDGGYKIVTTINKGAEDLAIASASEQSATSPMHPQVPTIQAALVSIDPTTGGVVAYYGGDKGTDVDFAGTYLDESGQPAGYGKHPPGSSFKVYTLAAALSQGISLNSYWQWTPHPQVGRADNQPVHNAEDCETDLLRDPSGNPIKGFYKNADGSYSDPTFTYKSGSSTHLLAATGLCSLLQSLIDSLNIPFYDVATQVSPAAVLKMAHAAGINYIWNGDGKRIDLNSVSPDDAVHEGIGSEVGFGQFPVTPLEHANGIATIANNGHRVDAHFVKEVDKGDKKLYGETLPNPNAEPILNPQQINDLTYAMSQTHPGDIGGYEQAVKTGTWEAANGTDNAHVWLAGFTTKLATVTYVGNKNSEDALIDQRTHKAVFGVGLAFDIWKMYMKDAPSKLNLAKDKTKFNPPSFVGDDNPGGLTFPSPLPTDTPVETTTEPTEAPTSGPPSGHPSSSGSPAPSGSSSPSP